MSVITEKYHATVSAVNDPQMRGRIRATCVGLLGDEDSELPMWIEPDFAWGWFIVPDVGEIVEIEVTTAMSDDEHVGQASIANLNPRWRNRNWTAEEVEGQNVPRPVPTDFTSKNYGKRRGMCTPLGHVIMFDDTKGGTRVSISWTDGDGKHSFMAFEPDGSFVVGVHTGHLLQLDATNGALSLIDQHGNLYASDATGIRLMNANSSIFEMRGDNIQILAQAGATIRCQDAVIEAGKIQLGGHNLIEALLLGTSFITNAFAVHTHLGVTAGPGVTGPPDPAALAAANLALSTKVFGS
jgi:hypothetical protein